ncbi:MAG: ABC transporter permease [Candidatus Helarchaeota archaeon]
MRIKQIWVLTRKNLELYFKKGPVIIFGLLIPFFMSLAWILGRPINAIQLYSGMLGMMVFFLGTAISPVIFPWETREKNLERVFILPITLLDIIFGISLASIIYSFLMSTVVYVILVLILQLSWGTLIWFIIGTFLLSWISSFIGVMISSIPTDMTSNIMTISTLVKFPLIFISGIFIPLTELSQVLFILALCSPITYYVDLLQVSCGAGVLGFEIDLIVLSIWALSVFILAFLLHRLTLLKRF